MAARDALQPADVREVLTPRALTEVRQRHPTDDRRQLLADHRRDGLLRLDSGQFRRGTSCPASMTQKTYQPSSPPFSTLGAAVFSRLGVAAVAALSS